MQAVTVPQEDFEHWAPDRVSPVDPSELDSGVAGDADAVAATMPVLVDEEDVTGGTENTAAVTSHFPLLAEDVGGGEATSVPAVEARDVEPGADEAEGEEEVEGEVAAAPVDDAEGDVGEDVSGEGRLDSIIESLLLAAGAPLPVRRIVEVVGGTRGKQVRAALERLMERYSGANSGIHLVDVAGGFQFRTSPVNARFVRTLLREKPSRLGRAALETLSIVAYKQPVTRGEIEAIRGVDADSAINTLLARRLIKIDGRKESVGRPLLYATTAEFLEVFGLRDLRELPTLKEIGPVPEPEEYDAEIEDEDGAVRTVEAALNGAAAAGVDESVAAEAGEPATNDGDERGAARAVETAPIADRAALEREARAQGGRDDDDFDDDDEDGEDFEDDDDFDEDEADDFDEDDDFDFDEDDEEEEDD